MTMMALLAGVGAVDVVVLPVEVGVDLIVAGVVEGLPLRLARAGVVELPRKSHKVQIRWKS